MRTGRPVTGLVTAEGRECTGCRQFKPWSEFSPLTRRFKSGTGHRSTCKLCRAQEPKVDPLASRLSHVASKFGLSPADYAWLKQLRPEVCWLCGEPERWRGSSGAVNSLGIDHDHECPGHPASKGCKLCIRGLLCNDCNQMLAFAERHPAVAARFRDYLVSRPFALRGGDA